MKKFHGKMFYSCVNSYELFGDVILFDSTNTLFTANKLYNPVFRVKANKFRNSVFLRIYF